MRSTRRVAIHSVFTLATLLILAPAAFAGGPLEVCRPGVPYAWPNGGANIPWNPDQGTLGPLSNAAAVSFVAASFGAWDAIPSASTSYLRGAPLPEDVTIENFFPYIFPSAPDGLSAIVFDDTGEIFDLLFGPDSGVLGFAGPEWLDPAACQIAEGVAFLNGPTFTSAQVSLDIMVHEFGHYQNLAHTVVNGQIVLGDTSGPTPNNTFPIGSLGNRIETMYPFYFGPGSGFATPDKDDIGMLSTIYPSPTFFATTGVITGRILASNGTTPKTGFNVIARNVANPMGDAVSSISSDMTRDYSPDAPLVGVYTLRGLTPGAQYAIFVDGLQDGGFSTPPAVLPGPEEFYNGASESSNSATDVPTALTPVPAIAGTVVEDIDIIFNRFVPGAPLPLTDDNSLQLALPFRFRMCGNTYEEVIVNANGTLSFGAPNNDFSESVPEFLAGPPQIAGLWDDLNPIAGGTVTFHESRHAFTVTFSGVPERTGATTGVGSNTFSITLKRLLSQIQVSYGAMSAVDGLAGVSCGGAITSGFETPTDLSDRAGKIVNLLFQPAVFELFVPPTATSPGNPNDLSNLSLHYTPTTDYFDLFEPNNTLARARRVSLPFNTIPVLRFTELSSPDDVDYFRFQARAGQVIVAQILTSQIDTVLGLFHRGTGQLLAADDDSGPGPLSRLTFTIPLDGEYAVAVSSFPDFEFDGGGEGGTGRYVLDVRVQPPPPAATTTRLDAPNAPFGIKAPIVDGVVEGAARIALMAIPPAESYDRFALIDRRVRLGRLFARS
jgi:hypothetical protein